MDYLYEQLGDERFQELCQALLTKELHNVQCFPVGQPDGGRDAVAYFALNKGDTAFSVFQVKYVRNPFTEKDIHKWLLKILEEEGPKLRNLVPKGAKAYYLITNIPGTSHLDSGSIDKCQQILGGNLTVPAFCWWRNDLNRRMDNAYDLKWVYPEVMAGTDMLRLIVESGLTEDKERRTSAIRTFVRAQYDDDEEVRFKQVELQNKLLDLFVDVPIRSRSGMEERKYQPLFERLKRQSANPREEESLGAATMLLDSKIQQYIPQVILEGAPGQGKSTLAQYICQVHRMRILEKNEILKSLPEEHIPNFIKIPFKVDLRDLALWLNKRDPFSSEEKDAIPANWYKSLEAFLAAQVRHFSGGAEFSVTDLHAVGKLSALLIVLDGLDEVADITERKEVVSAIVSGVNRLKELAASLQVLVTSRPTAFVTSLGFPEKDFPHFHLLSLSKPLIFTYGNKWLAARKLNEKDASTVRRILKQKIEQPHLRDLARNPMQLAILLSLIHTRGPSLPDKRTSLYDGYVDLFFNREAEKSEVVRDNRDILIDLHRYLAWVLHYETEKRVHRGSISSERLQQLLSDYLISEGREASLVTDLFKGMVERIFFIVSRVEGTFEFEVQPLREYFAGRHLYETAPYSPPGNERRGTKPDRFDAIVQNQYWLNVTRFFAGCFSKGELPSLVDRLHELADRDGYQYTNYPKRVAAILLSDWVFSQDQRSTREAVELVLNGVGLRHPLIKRRYIAHSAYTEDSFVLPKGCGREQLIERCFYLLRNRLPEDYVAEIAQLLRANGASDEAEPMWFSELKQANGTELTYWLKSGQFLGALSNSSPAKLEEALSGKALNAKRLDIILNSGHADFIETSEERTEILVAGILDGDVSTFSFFRRNTNLLTNFARALEPYRYASAFENQAPIPLRTVIDRYTAFAESDADNLDESITTEINNPILQKCAEVVRIAEHEINRNAIEWATDLTGWENVVEPSRSAWGDHWKLFQLANLAASIKSEEVHCREYSDLLDHSQPLCRRVRHARLKASAHKWWQSQIENARTRMDKLLVSLVFLSWAGPSAKVKLLHLMQDMVDKLPSTEWQLISEAISDLRTYARSKQSSSMDIESLPKEISARMVTALGENLAGDSMVELFTAYLTGYDGDDDAVLAFCEKAALNLVRHDPKNWEIALPYIEKRYAKGKSDSAYQRYIRSEHLTKSLPFEVAKDLAQNPSKYPRNLVYLAEERCELEVMTKVEPVGNIAEREGWFERSREQRRSLHS
jgi:hypothetical protein